MKIRTPLLAIPTLVMALVINAHAQVYQFSEPLTGSMTVSVEDANGPGGASGMFYLDFTNLSETIYYDPVGQTLRQIGTISVTPTATNIQFTEIQGGVSGTVTVDLAPAGGNFLSFDTGPLPLIWEASSSSYYCDANLAPPFPFSGSYSLVTGGQTYAGSFSYSLSSLEDNGFYAAYTFYDLSLSNYPASIHLAGLGAAGETTTTFPSPGTVATATASNGFKMELNPGLESYQFFPVGELFQWSSPNLTVTNLTVAPYITTAPQSEVAQAGQNASFSVAAVGVAPLSYQWQFDTTNIPDATNATLSLADVALTNAGTYNVTISNADGSTNSANALLTVTPGPVCDPPPSSLVGWWPGDGNTLDIAGGDNGTAGGGLTYAPGEVGEAFSFSSGSYVECPATSALNVGTGGGLSIEFWLNPADISNSHPLVEWNNGATYGTHFWLSVAAPGVLSPGCIYINLVDTEGNSHYVSTPAGVVAVNKFQHVAATYDHDSGIATLYCDGAFEAAENLGIFTPQTSYNLYFGLRPSGGPYYTGLMDEVSVYNRALSSSEIQALYAAGVAGKCGAPPTVATQPQNQVAHARSNVSFTVSASGSLPLSYQWSFNGTNILDATSSSFTITNVNQNNLGTYAVLITNDFGETNSADATLSMYPFLVDRFAGLVTDWGYTNTLSVEAEGTGPLDYQWFDNGIAIEGATNNTFTLTAIQFTNAGLYSVVVSNAFGSVTNTPEQVVVNPAGISFGGLYPSVLIQGVVGYNYIIQSTTNLSNTNAWITLTNLTLSQPTQLWIDSNTDASLPTNPMRYYQVLPGQ